MKTSDHIVQSVVIRDIYDNSLHLHNHVYNTSTLIAYWVPNSGELASSAVAPIKTQEFQRRPTVAIRISLIHSSDQASRPLVLNTSNLNYATVV